MAEIVTRKRGNKWEYRFQTAIIGGKRKYSSKSGFRTKGDALEAGIKALSEYNLTGRAFIPSEVGFYDYIDEWINTYCKTNLKDTTIRGYKKKIRLYILPALGSYKLKNVNAAVLQKLMNELFDNGLSRNTLSVIKGILSNSLSYAVQPMGYIQSSPMLYVKLPSTRAEPGNKAKASPHFYIEKSDMEAIFKRFSDDTSAHLPLMIAYKCGLRLGEVFGLTWDNIDVDTKMLTVKQQIQWHERNTKSSTDKSYWYVAAPKYNSIRTISIDDDLALLLQKAKEEQTKNKLEYCDFYINNYIKNGIINQHNGELMDFVCVRESGEFIQPRIMQHTSTVINKELGIHFTFHSLRHTHCTMLLSAGAAPKYVQTRLGHKNIKVTLQVYQHLTPEMTNAGDNILNDIYTKGKENTDD